MRVSEVVLTCVLILGLSIHVSAREYIGEKSNSSKEQVKSKAANCSPAQTQSEFVFNNVRTAAETGGNTWYDRGDGQPLYEVPEGGRNHAIFAGALWMGGTDPAGNLKLAAVRFRQQGNDFWPGPLSENLAAIEPETCLAYDRFWNTSRQDVETHRYYFTLINQGIDPNTDPLFEDNPYEIPIDILNWPAHGNTSLGQSRFLAPFADLRDPETGEILTTPELYEPELGDYPLYDLDSEIDCRTRLVTDPVPLFGDNSMYWIFNDAGNIHTESQGEPIGMEIQAQMFSFNTNDEVNNMTFCNYVLINRGTLTLQETFFAQWVDTDLGNFNDDYIGCDVGRGLGYSYNGDNFDEGSTTGPGYGEQPPAIGVDFFEGPYQDPDGINNLYGIGEGQALNGLGYRNESEAFPDSVIDNERFGMRRFLYHNNSSGPVPTQDPTVAIEYYNMMRGIWNNGTPMTFGGQGFNPNDPSALGADFMFPGESDPLNWGTQGVDPNYGTAGGWTEENEGNEAGDRRFVQSAGPFTLDPGEFNNITVGAVFARARTGGPFASVNSLFIADDKAQALFENCFRLLSGPDAPDLTVQELDRELIFYLRNTNPLSNNTGEEYFELDPTIPESDEEGNPFDQTYNFQGYQVYQVRDEQVSAGDLEDPELARLVFQVDIEDRNDSTGQPIAQLINYELDEQIGLSVPVEKVNGANEGIRHSFRLTTDQFAQGDNQLINFKKYYFIAVAYGYNEFEPYSPDPAAPTGQASPYIVGRASSSGGAIPVVTAIPSKPNPRNFGTVASSSYGEGLPVTRIEGTGNGGNELRLTEESIADIVTGFPYKADSLVYQAGFGPVDARIVDPLNVRAADFVLKFYNDIDENGRYTGDFETSRWFMIDSNNPLDTIFSENTIQIANEQIIPEYGISIEIGQYEYDPANSDANKFLPALLNSSIEYGGEEWFIGVPDQEGFTYLNWIRSGTILTDDVSDPPPGASSPCWLPDGTAQNPDPFPWDPFWDDRITSTGTAEQGGNALDGFQIYENVVDGTIAPALLVVDNNCGLGPLSTRAWAEIDENTTSFDLTDINSVVVKITPDKSLWSRVPVFEMQHEEAFAQLGSGKMELRGALSVDKNGLNQSQPGVNEDEATYFGEQVFTQEYVDELIDLLDQDELQSLLSSYDREYPSLDIVTGSPPDLVFDAQKLVGLSFGMGWFPGYAVNVETGERLNMAFSENSYFGADNGRDMLWNPSSRIGTTFGQLFMAGEHYYYVFSNNALLESRDNQMPLYDGGTFSHNTLTFGNFFAQNRTYGAIQWIGFPRLAPGFEYLSPEEGLVPGEVTISASLAKPYAPYVTAAEELGEESVPFVSPDSSLTLSDNQWYPMYGFSTKGFEVSVNQQEVAVEALDIIDIVPNPYYAYSSYEQSRVDNRVKFVNLPPECKIQIFTLNGTLVRILEKDNPNTFLEWDLQNESFIPVAGGMYLIHVSVPGVGDTVLKFFMATRPADLRNL